MTKDLLKNKNLKHQLKYSSPSYHINTSINKTNSSLIKNKIATPNVTVFLDSNIQYNEKKKNELIKSINGNINSINCKCNNTSLNKNNNNCPSIKRRKQIDLIKNNIKNNSIKKKVITSSNTNINSTFNSSINKSLNHMYKNKVNHIKKNELLCLFENLKDNKIKRIQLSNNNYNNNSSKEKNLKLIDIMNKDYKNKLNLISNKI